LRPGEDAEPSPRPEHAFIYSITNIETGMVYVGRTDRRLSKRWEGHRSDRKREERKNDPLYRAMNECGLQMFVMEVLEECGISIMDAREYDYMRKLDSWNPLSGYNSPECEATYARRLYFLLNPGCGERYYSVRQQLKMLDPGGMEPCPLEETVTKEFGRRSATSLREGRRLMKKISSLASPVVIASAVSIKPSSAELQLRTKSWTLGRNSGD